MSMRQTLYSRTQSVDDPIGDNGDGGVAAASGRMSDPGLDGESSISAPPLNAPTEASPPQVPAEEEHPSNIAGDDGAPPAPAGPTIGLNSAAYAAGNTCVQCGLCLPACPTYLET